MFLFLICDIIVSMKKELNKEFITWLSNSKGESDFMKEFRLQAYEIFLNKNEPDFGPELDIDFDKIVYYKKENDHVESDWNKVNENIKNTFSSLGVIEAENKFLAGVTNQYESEVVYHNTKGDEKIIFTSSDEALKKYPELFKKYFNSLVKYDENKYTALNGALWSGGSFIYIPPHTKLDRPLQSYFRIDSEGLGQFERTIIIVDDYSSLEYIEGCTAKSYSSTALHAGVVEIFVGKHAKCRYSTIQNWSNDVYNLVTKRAIVDVGGQMEWIDGNIGSKVTMKYPCSILKGDGSSASSLSIAYAKGIQELDAGAKMIHLGKNTKSNIVSKSIAESSGTANYRGIVRIGENACNSKAYVKCDTLILDELSKSDTFPKNIVENDSSLIEHEATISKLSEEKLYYLMRKGLSMDRAKELLVMGFIDDLKKELPMEYAVELNRLIKES